MSDETPLSHSTLYNTLPEERALRADIYALIAALLRQAPEAELLEWLAALEIERDGTRLAAAWQGLADAAAVATPEALERAHFRHLVGVIQGEITPYASWYRQGELMETALVELRQDLKTLGIERSEHTRDPEDHLAALCEVMAMLIQADMNETDEREQATFFVRHVAPWAADCWGDLARVDTPFYAALGEVGSAFMESEQARLRAVASEAPVRIVEPQP
ncbi:TorD/DmsD family molecular chaperone [Vreelandella salicampi]|uniref:Molecular chaperone TorD family protein n=1 Tax=Vreelandella salicampi TaxID=1449798 RepID=A0A7Z0LMQ8_9GAMM|nr:molecular chaperone TorD family protein [Halomonas salicampi]NYS61787.1 molecular chaperone TorD family protein [Halomonas salicampi]